MKSKSLFLIALAAVIAGCSLDEPEYCPIWLDDSLSTNNEGDDDGDKTRNCWDVCPYNNQITAKLTRDMIMAHPLMNDEWVYVCNLNNYIREDDYSDSFSFNTGNSVFHIYKAEDIEKYRSLPEREQITGIVFHGTINLAENETSCDNLAWESIPVPDRQKFKISGTDDAKLVAYDENAKRCELSQPLFDDLSQVEVSDLNISMDFKGDLHGTLTNQIQKSTLSHITFSGTLTSSAKSDAIPTGLIAGLVSESDLNQIQVTDYDDIAGKPSGVKSMLVLDSGVPAAGGVTGNLVQSSFTEGNISMKVAVHADVPMVGGLTGYMDNSSIIKTRINSLDIELAKNAKSVGGMVAEMSQSALNDNQSSDVTIKVQEVDFLGGMSGVLSTESSVNNGNQNNIHLEAKEAEFIGGIAGDSSNSIITNNGKATGITDTMTVIADNTEYLGGIAGRFSFDTAQGGSSSSQVSSVNSIYLSKVSIEIKHALTDGYVGGLFGTLENATIKDVELNNISLYQIDESTSQGGAIKAVGGITGIMKASQIYNSAIRDINTSFPNITSFGGIAGDMDGSRIQGCSFENASFTINKATYLAGIAGRVINSYILTSIHNNLQISNQSATFLAGVAGTLINSRIVECSFETLENSRFNSFTTKSVVYFGGIAGNVDHNSEISGGNLVGMRVNIDNSFNYCGGIAGRVEGGYISGSNMDDTVITVKQNKIDETRTYVGGCTGYIKDYSERINKTAAPDDKDTCREFEIKRTPGEIRSIKQSNLRIVLTDSYDNSSTEVHDNYEQYNDSDVVLDSDKNCEISENDHFGNVGVEAVGGVAGRSDNSSIHGCNISNYSISAQTTNNIGGIIGYMQDTELVSNDMSLVIDNLSDTVFNDNGTITGLNYVGGLVGRMLNSQISSSTVTSSSINGKNYIGGAIGKILTYGVAAKDDAYSNSIINSYIRETKSITDVVQGRSHVGGFTGSLENAYGVTTLSWCLNQVDNVIGQQDNIGGFIGDIDYKCDDLMNFTNINNHIQSISGQTNVGGIAGLVHRNSQIVNNCFLDPNIQQLSTLIPEIPVTYHGVELTLDQEDKDSLIAIFLRIINNIASNVVNDNVLDVVSINSIEQDIEHIEGDTNVSGLIGFYEDHTNSPSTITILGMNSNIHNLIGHSHVAGAVGRIDVDTLPNDAGLTASKIFSVGSATIINAGYENDEMGAGLIGGITGAAAIDLTCGQAFFVPKELVETPVTSEALQLKHILSLTDEQLNSIAYTTPEGDFNINPDASCLNSSLTFIPPSIDPDNPPEPVVIPKQECYDKWELIFSQNASKLMSTLSGTVYDNIKCLSEPGYKACKTATDPAEAAACTKIYAQCIMVDRMLPAIQTRLNIENKYRACVDDESFMTCYSNMQRQNDPHNVWINVPSRSHQERELTHGTFNDMISNLLDETGMQEFTPPLNLTQDQINNIADKTKFAQSAANLTTIRSSHVTFDEKLSLTSSYFMYGHNSHETFYLGGAAKCVHQAIVGDDYNNKGELVECMDASTIPIGPGRSLMLYLDALTLFNDNLCSYSDLETLVETFTRIVDKQDNKDLMEPIRFKLEVPSLVQKPGSNAD